MYWEWEIYQIFKENYLFTQIVSVCVSLWVCVRAWWWEYTLSWDEDEKDARCPPTLSTCSTEGGPIPEVRAQVSAGLEVNKLQRASFLCRALRHEATSILQIPDLLPGYWDPNSHPLFHFWVHTHTHTHLKMLTEPIWQRWLSSHNNIRSRHGGMNVCCRTVLPAEDTLENSKAVSPSKQLLTPSVISN